MTRFKLKLVTWTFVVIFSVVKISAAANTGIIRDMSDVIEMSNLSSEKKKLLTEVVRDVFTSAKEVEQDKTTTAKSNLNVYLADRIIRQNYTDSQFGLAAKVFQYHLENYALLPVIDETQRNNSKKVINEFLEITMDFINENYADSPQAARDQIYAGVNMRVSVILGRVGNYFYPSYLYRKPGGFSRKEVMDTLKRSVPKGRINTLAVVESTKIYSTLQPMLAALFSLESAIKEKKLKSMSPELLKERKIFEQERYREGQAAQVHKPVEMQYRDVVKKISVGASQSTVVSGLNVDKIMPTATLQPTTPPAKSELNR